MIDHLNKLSWIYLCTEAIYYFTNEKANDHSKRCLSRYFFVQIDNFLKIIGAFKNNITQQGLLNTNNKRLIEDKIRLIGLNYENQYSTIRDKFGGHHQPLSIIDINNWCNEIDLTTVIILYQYLIELKSYFESFGVIFGGAIRDYSQLEFSDSPLAPQSESIYRLSHDRLGLTKENTLAMISENESQAKAQLILSIVDLIFINCYVTKIVESPDTSYKSMIFDIAWLLILCDTCSLIDNLYEDTSYDKSLLSYWKDDFNGYDIIVEGNNSRDVALEERIREVRNKIGAHLDSNMTMDDLYMLFNNIKLPDLHNYIIYHMNIFRTGCQNDIRTRKFAMRDTELTDIKGLAYSPFEKSDE